MDNKTGKLIEKYRKAKGLTQHELAKQLGVSNTAISKWEHGNNLPDITLIEPLSEILGIDKLILFTSEHQDKEEKSEKNINLKRSKFIQLTINVLIFIIAIIFSNYLSYKVYNNKLNKIQNSQTDVYTFYSNDPEYIVNGYIIYKDDQSVLLFNEFKYQNKDAEREKIQKEQEILSIELYFYIDEKTILRNMYKPKENESKDINEILFNLSKTISQKRVELPKDKIKNPTFELIINTNDDEITKIIKVELDDRI